MLARANKFFCDACCGLQEAEKRLKIKRLPNVLALHLKRFKYQEDAGRYVDSSDEEDAEEDNLDGCSGGRYKSFGERSSLSVCGFNDADLGCLGGF